MNSAISNRSFRICVLGKYCNLDQLLYWCCWKNAFYISFRENLGRIITVNCFRFVGLFMNTNRLITSLFFLQLLFCSIFGAFSSTMTIMNASKSWGDFYEILKDMRPTAITSMMEKFRPPIYCMLWTEASFPSVTKYITTESMLIWS